MSFGKVLLRSEEFSFAPRSRRRGGPPLQIIKNINNNVVICIAVALRTSCENLSHNLQKRKSV